MTPTVSVAASIVATAAERIGDVDPQDVIANLEKEKVREDWQLEYLDSHQWQVLGAPMGLVASIRRCLTERKQQQKQLEESMSSLKVGGHHTNPHADILTPMRSPPGKLKRGFIPAPISPMRSVIGRPTSPARSVTTVTTVSSHATISELQPPAMPLRKESQNVSGTSFPGAEYNNWDDSTMMSEARDTVHMLPEYMGGAIPPVLPVRVESISSNESSSEFFVQNSHAAAPAQGSYRQQAYGGGRG